jgi:hypothetical protein
VRQSLGCGLANHPIRARLDANDFRFLEPIRQAARTRQRDQRVAADAEHDRSRRDDRTLHRAIGELEARHRIEVEHCQNWHAVVEQRGA